MGPGALSSHHGLQAAVCLDLECPVCQSVLAERTALCSQRPELGGPYLPAQGVPVPCPLEREVGCVPDVGVDSGLPQASPAQLCLRRGPRLLELALRPIFVCCVLVLVASRTLRTVVKGCLPSQRAQTASVCFPPVRVGCSEGVLPLHFVHPSARSPPTSVQPLRGPTHDGKWSCPLFTPPWLASLSTFLAKEVGAGAMCQNL